MVKGFCSLFLSACLILLTSCGSGGGSTSNNGGNNGGGNGGSGGGTGNGTLQSLNHIIFTLQENRSFDHYFGKLNAYRAQRGLGADVDGLDKTNPVNPGRDGVPINAFKMVSACTEDVSPAWNSSHAQRNHNNPDVSSPDLMNGFAQTAGGYTAAFGGNDINGARAMGYYDQDILPYYYYMATQFATSDRFFSPVMTKSEPNRMYAMAATSVGQIAIPGKTFNVKTIFDLLNAANVSWKIYKVDPSKAAAISYFQPFTQQNLSHIVPLDQYFTDLKNNSLPSVAFIEHAGPKDEHPLNNVQQGAKLMADVINALIASPYWKDSAFILSYDEGGGLYDHVGPLQTVNPDGVPVELTPNNQNTFGDNFTRSGFRVPMFIVSPFAKKNFVSHTPMDFTAILKLIETRWKLPNLTARDAAQPDMTEFFDFAGAPWATPPTDIPAQPTSAPCYRDHLP